MRSAEWALILSFLPYSSLSEVGDGYTAPPTPNPRQIVDPRPGVHGAEAWTGAQGAPLDTRRGAQWPMGHLLASLILS